MLPGAINKDKGLAPLAAFHMTSFAKSRERGRASHHIPYHCGDGRGRLTGQNEGRQPRRQLFRQMTPAFDSAAHTMHLTTPANRPGRGVRGSGWGRQGQAKASFTLPALGPATPCVCVDCASPFSSLTSPRCHGVKGLGMLPHGFPNPLRVK